MVQYTGLTVSKRQHTDQYYQQQQTNGMSPAGNAAAANPAGGQPFFTTPTGQAGSNPNQVMAAMTASSGGTLNVVNDQAPYYFQIDLSDYHRSGWNDVGQLVISSTVIMPMPVNLGSRQSVSWEKKKLDFGGAGALSVAAGKGGITSGNPAADAAAIAAAAGSRTLGNAAQGTLAYYGMADNFYETLMLVGPTLREYTFRFELSAKTPQESYNLQNLYWILSGAAAPGLGDYAASLFFTYPKIAQLTFHGPTSTGTMESQLFAFKPAAIVDLAWDFGPQGQPSFFAGTAAPESIVLQASFTELSYWVASDYGVTPPNNLAAAFAALGKSVGDNAKALAGSITAGLAGGG